MIDLSVRSMGRVWALTLGGTLLCVAVTLAVDSFTFAGKDPEALRHALIVDIVLPTVLAGPLLFLLLRKIRALAIAHDEMAHMASTDSLTAVLNRGAFNMLVEAYLGSPSQSLLTTGALLIIDADHFKAINDNFGHQAGDTVLRGIAHKIKSVLRETDLVGRIGGEEFGVFLPGATQAHATAVAERIRGLITELPPPGAGPNLSVSIGGVTFRKGGDYETLFKVADQCLYEAKESGRNQVRMRDYIGRSRAA